MLLNKNEDEKSSQMPPSHGLKESARDHARKTEGRARETRADETQGEMRVFITRHDKHRHERPRRPERVTSVGCAGTSRASPLSSREACAPL